MRLTEQQIRNIIRKTILEQAAPTLRAEIEPASAQALEAVKTAIGITGGPAILEMLISLKQGDTEGLTEKGAEESAEPILDKAIEISSKDLIKSGAQGLKNILGAVFLAKSIYGTFTYLPNLLMKSIEQMKTVEGILKKQASLLKKPVDKLDSSTKPSPITGTVITHQMAVDAIAASIDSGDKETQGFYASLIAPEYLSLNGYTLKGPVITQRFAAEILKRRKQLEDQITKEMKDLVTKNWSALSPEVQKDFEMLAKAAVKRKGQSKS